MTTLSLAKPLARRLMPTLVMAAVAGCTPSAIHPPTVPFLPPLAITNVTMVDTISGSRTAGTVIFVTGDKITAAGPAVDIPANARRVDGSGKFAIPGLWDMHAHHQASGRESLNLFLVNGVVGTRDMGSDVDFILPLRAAIDRGEVMGPAIVAAGPILDSAPPDWPWRQTVRKAAAAKTAVGTLQQAGVDFIKVHDRTPREAFFAIAAETRARGLSFAGHVPTEITIEEAAGSGMKSIEHLANGRVYQGCSGPPEAPGGACGERFRQLAAAGVWQTPTLAFYESLPTLLAEGKVRHAPFASDGQRVLWKKNLEAADVTPEMLAQLRGFAAAQQRGSKALLESGSRFLAGSDGLIAGFSLHDELVAMVEAGFSPLQALQAATVNPAIYFGRLPVAGTIAAGSRADIILLDADPLLDIRNIRKVSSVLAGGRLLTSRYREIVLREKLRSHAATKGMKQ